MAINKKQQRQTIDRIFVLLGVVVAAVLFLTGIIAWNGYSYATTSVRDELLSQKIFFPPKGSPALDPAEFPGLQKYAGQQVDNGPKAKAYANQFIAAHLKKVANGQTYSEVSTKVMSDPTNATLQQQKQTLFQGETLRGLLLGDGYSYWTIGILARDAAIVAFVGASIMTLLVLLGLGHMRRSG